MGARGANVQEITTNFEVGIKFPDRPAANGGMYGIFGGKALNVQCCVTDLTYIFKHLSYSGFQIRGGY